ncbi:MAG: ATP-binding protein [Candidatus Omnitrophota bacterium]
MTYFKKKVKLTGKVRAVYKQMGKAIYDYKMLSEGDKLLVAVSGGADSLALLKLFLMRKRRVPFDFKIIACFVDTNFIETDKDLLVKYFEDNGVNYIIKNLEIKKEDRNCFWCSWSRRKILFETAKTLGCNKIALGHNLDDITETILMNMFFFAQISSAPPALDMFSGRVKLIRPLAYLKKKDVFEFAQQLLLPFVGHSCPYGQETRREKVKKIIRELEENCPQIKKNIFRSLGKIRGDYLV